MILKNRFLTLLFLLVSLVVAHGQKNSIYGKISDESGSAIEFANVTLIRLPDSVNVSGIMTDSLGRYQFSDCKVGEYTVKASLVGYKENFSKSFLFNSSSFEANLVLEEDVLEGQEISITMDRPLVRQEADKMVVDVENTVNNSGLSAIDVLRKSPGISVDKDGKIELKGKKGVLVMIDDKPLYMSEEQVGNLLKSIPSDQIKELELITSPSAKYDAVGNAGIINIRLKKIAYEGFNGDFLGSFGHGVYHKSNAGANVAYKKKKLSLNGGYQYSNKLDLSDFYNHRTYAEPSNPYSGLNTDSYYRLPRTAHTLNFSSGYKFNQKSDLGFDANSSYSELRWNGGSTSTLFNTDGSISNYYINKDVGVSKPTTINTNLTFRHRPDTNGTLISSAVNYNGYFGKEVKDLSIQYYDSQNQNTGIPFIFILRNQFSTDAFSAKLDFTKNIKKIKWESGLKINLTQNNSPVNIAITENSVSRDESNHFIYIENIYAAYTMMYKTIGKWKLQGGLRLENTQTRGVQSITDSTFKRNYTNLFPSGSINFNPTTKTSYTLSYSRRIQRPNAWQLNPILNILDPYTYWGGNPYLLPQYTDNVELAYSVFSGYIITTLGYAQTVNPITYVVLTESNSPKIISGQRNLESQRSVGVSVAVNLPITTWWSSNNYVHVFNNKYTGDVGLGNMSNQQTQWLANCTQTIKLPKKYTLEISGVYEPSGIYGLSTYFTRWQANIGLQKKLLENRANVKVAVSDIFWTFKYGGKSTLETTNIKNSFKWDNRVVMLTLTYKVGKRVILATEN